MISEAMKQALAGVPNIEDVKPKKGRWANYKPVRPRCRRCGKAIAAGSPSRHAVYCSRACYALSRTRTRPRSTCKVCGKPAPNTLQRSCSKKCADMLRITRETLVCRVCSKRYRPSGNIRLKYCSRRCYDVVRSSEAFESFKCDHCGKERHRRKVRTRPHAHRFCDRTCREKFYVGERHSHWRGGSDPNRGAQWLKIAAAIRERDSYVCQRCGRTQAENGRRLDVDHIKPWRSFEDEKQANAPENLVSLCHRCHKSKTSGAERAWLKGDRMAMLAYEKAVKLPPLFSTVTR